MLSGYTLTMLNVAAILSLRALPGLADYGLALVTYLALAAACFFIPSALVSAELASGWSGEGGVYLWVKEAFGPRWGFVAIFMQWVENLPWFPAVLAFAASDLAYVVSPDLAQSKAFTVAVIWAALWLATLLNFRDMRLSAFFSSSGAMAGTIIPGLVIIGLGLQYVLSGAPAQLTFSARALAPDFGSPEQLMLLAAMLVSFLGMEMSAVHVNEVARPGRTYPRAIFAAAAIILLLSALGGLAIAAVLPAGSVSLSAGVCQAFDALFRLHRAPWLTPVVALLMAYGALAMVVTWMAGPAKGLLQVAREGHLPPSWRRANAHGMPVNVLLIQTGLSCLLSLAILFMPTVSSAFMLMSALAAQLYLIMYLLLFAAAIRLRYTRPDVPRGYSIPGGKAGIWLVSGVALATSVFVFCAGFIPPAEVLADGPLAGPFYVLFLVCGIVAFTAIPLRFYAQSLKTREGLAAAALEPE